MKQKHLLKNVLDRGHSGFARVMTIVALMLFVSMGAWGMQIYISYPSWPTGTIVNGDGNLVLEMEASDSFENMKAKIGDKSGLNPDYMKLYFNSVEMANNETLNAKGVTSNSVLTLVYTLYNVTMKDGTQDAAKWTATVGTSTTANPLPVGGLSEGDAVTLKYSGDRQVKSVTATTDAGPGPLTVPLTIEAITAGSIIVAHPKAGMQFSLDGGKTKNAVTTDAIPVAAGDKVQFYGDGTNITCYGDAAMDDCTMIGGDGDGFTCKVYGNIMSLLDEKNFAKAKTLSDRYTFKFLFYNNTKLTDASGLLLPATTLQESCYRSMFDGCTALAAAPALPATQLAMHCYREMFNGCSALTAAPVLPATKLVMYCYFSMFNYCQKLATVTCLATSGINQDYSTSYWLNGAGSQAEGTKTVNTVSSAYWPSGDNGIPTGWTRENIDN